MQEAYVRILSPNVQVHFGFRDGHAVVRVRLPIPLRPWYSVKIDAKDIIRFKDPFDRAYEFGCKPESERKDAKPVEFEARSDCRGRFGFPDAHVVLEVKRVAWIPLDFIFEEFKLAKAAMDEAYAWALLPQDVREFQGVC